MDKYAEKSYCAIHGVDRSLNLGDITKVDETRLKPFNMICGGSPCQDFSTAGRQAGSRWKCKDCGAEYNPLTVHYTKRDQCPVCGANNLDKTRSSLLVEWLRIIRANKPSWGIYENVKNIVGKQFKDTFHMFLEELHEYGYNTYYKVLNANDYGVPQSRERVYLIIIRKELDNGKFKFPSPFPLTSSMQDALEETVDERYYLSDDKIAKLNIVPPMSDSISKTIMVGGRNSTDRNHTCDLIREKPVKLSNKGTQFDGYCDVAVTLLVRDYKGFGNQGMNAVLVYGGEKDGKK